ncbi:MAG: putative inositol-requiring enzyme-1, partial [Streblomastix strix]
MGCCNRIDKTLSCIVEKRDKFLSMCVNRALMKQILEGMRVFHYFGLVHRDIKCDNILLHCPPGSGRVHAKISDFGFAKKENVINELTYLKGTLQYMGPELFQQKIRATQKVDIYAVGITFYRLLTHKYPINCTSYQEQKQKIKSMKKIEKPEEIKEEILWDLLSKLLEFDPDKRITAEQALEHPFFTGREAASDISPEQERLATFGQFMAMMKGNESISEYDLDKTFIVPETEIKQIIGDDEDIIHLKQTQKVEYRNKKETTIKQLPNETITKSLEVYPSTQSSSTEVILSTQSSLPEVNPSTQSSSSSSQKVNPSTQSSSSEVLPYTQSSSSDVYPSTQSSSSEIYPSTQSSNILNIRITKYPYCYE